MILGLGDVMSTIQFKYENRFIRHSSLRYIFPPMVGMIFAQIAPFVDGVVVSNSLEEVALSAIGTTGPISYIFNIIAALGGIGCGVLISRCSGSGEKAKAARIFTRTLLMLIVSSVVLSITGIIFIDPLLHVLCVTHENYAFAKEYLLVTLAGAVFPVLNFAGDYILANDNNQKLAMAGDIVGAIVNIVVDYVGVCVLHLGIGSAAFGTVFGSFCCVLVYLLHFRKPDRLCRLVRLKRVPTDPSDFEIFKPGCAEAVMYCMYVVQLIIQNFVLRTHGGTMGISNSAVIENLTLVITIVIAGATDAIYPMAAAYDGEQNQSGMLMVKSTLAKIGFVMLAPIVAVLCVFPQLMIIPYGIDDPIMMNTLPFAIRLISVGTLISLITMLLIDYLSAIEEEKKATIALLVQAVAQISFTLILSPYLEMDAPWYAMFIGVIASLIYLWFFCNNLAEGIFRLHKKNLLLLTGGNFSRELIENWKAAVDGILSEKEFSMIKEKMLEPLLAAVPSGVVLKSSFTILTRDDGRLAVILRYESKEDYLGTDEDISEREEEDDDVVIESDVCIRSEFLGDRRLMIVLSGEAAIGSY